MLIFYSFRWMPNHKVFTLKVVEAWGFLLFFWNSTLGLVLKLMLKCKRKILVIKVWKLREASRISIQIQKFGKKKKKRKLGINENKREIHGTHIFLIPHYCCIQFGVIFMFSVWLDDVITGTRSISKLMLLIFFLKTWNMF